MATNMGKKWEIATKQFVERFYPSENLYILPCCKAMESFLEDSSLNAKPENWALDQKSGLAGELGIAGAVGSETVVPTVVAIITAVFTEISNSPQPLTEQAVSEVTQRYASQFGARSYLAKQLHKTLPEMWFQLCQPDGEVNTDSSFRVIFKPSEIIVNSNGETLEKVSKHARWEFLEYLLTRQNEQVHWLWGFLMFSAWRNTGNVENPQKTLKTRRSRIQSTLRQIHPDLKVEIKNIKKSPFWILTEANFDSNVTEANQLCTEAENALCNNAHFKALENAAQALQLHERNEKAIRIKASALVRSNFKGKNTEHIKSLFRQVSQIAINYGAAVEAIKTMDHKLTPLDKETVDIIKQNSQEFNEYTEAFEQFLGPEDQLPKDWLECKKFVSLAYDFHRHQNDSNKQNSILYQILKLPFVRTIREETANAFQQYKSNSEQAFQSAFSEVILQKKFWPMNSTQDIIKYFTKTLYAREHHKTSSYMQKELSAEKERLLRQYLDARQNLTEENQGGEPLEQEIREYLGWDETAYWEIHDIAQGMFRYKDPGQRFEEQD